VLAQRVYPPQNAHVRACRAVLFVAQDKIAQVSVYVPVEAAVIGRRWEIGRYGRR